MTEWTLLKRLLDAVHQHSTMIGRLWLTVMVIFRLLIVAVATEDVYADEQEMFVCNTLQPGCSTVCYDTFAPISQPRFWVFHIISVSTPSLCFIIYTWHNLSKLPKNRGHGQGHTRTISGETGFNEGREAYNHSCDSDSCSIRSHKHLGHSLVDVLESITNQSLQKGGTSHVVCLTQSQPTNHREGNGEALGVSRGVLSTCYVFHVCLRTMLEVSFVVVQWMLFGFEVPVHFLCSSTPCTQLVDCYVSRPTEKTIFLLFMFCVGVFCILLNLLELSHLGWKKIQNVVRLKESRSWQACPTLREGYETFYMGSPSLSTPEFRAVTSTTSLPTLDLVVGHQPDWTCTGNCTLLKEPEEGTETGLQLPKKIESHRGERQPLNSKTESRASQQRSREVWI